MKVSRFLGLLGLVSALSLAGAVPAASQATLGFIGGVSYAKVGDVNVNSLRESFDRRNGFHFGAFLEIGGSAFALRPAAIYLDAGKVFEGASFLNNDAFNLSFVSFPIDLRVRFGMVDFFGGPEFQRVISPSTDSTLQQNIENWVVSGGLGVGLRLGPLKPEVRFIVGLSDLIKSDFTIAGVNVSPNVQRTQELRASMGFVF